MAQFLIYLEKEGSVLGMFSPLYTPSHESESLDILHNFDLFLFRPTQLFFPEPDPEGGDPGPPSPE